MRDHITPAMHQQFMSMFERDTTSAENIDTTSEHPNPQSLIPSDLLDPLPQQLSPPPRHTYSLPPPGAKETYSMSSNSDPQTPPCPGCQRPSSPPLSRLLTLSWHQQWLYCTPEQANIWKPRNNELENLNKKLKKHVRFAFPHDADTDGEQDADSEQKQPPQPHPSPSSPPQYSLPTRPKPDGDNANGHSAPALQDLNHKPLETQTQRHTEDTHRAHADQASESVESKLAKREMRFEEEGGEGC